MPTTTPDPKPLNRRYNEEIDQYEERLDELEVAFNFLCDEIKAAAHRKLDALPKSDRLGRGQVLAEEKKELDRVLGELRTSIHKNGRDMRNALEKIQAEKDAMTADA